MSNKSDNKIIPIITGIIGFFGGIALVNNWLVLNREYPESEYLKVPFKPEAWGNIADWAMVTITLITAIYLIKTFKSQNKAIDLQHQALLEQQKITKIEQMMFKEKVKPYFSLNVVPKNQTINNDIAFYTYSFIFLLENSSANNIQITTSLFNSENNFGESLTYQKHQGDYIAMFETTYTQKKLSQQKDGADFIFRFEFTLVYDDILGNSYEQKIMFYEDNLGKTNYHAGGPADFLKKNV